METIWILAGSRHSATTALRETREATMDGEEFVTYRYIATADMIRGFEGERFLAVRGWKKHPEATEILKTLKQQHWEFVPFKDLFV